MAHNNPLLYVGAVAGIVWSVAVNAAVVFDGSFSSGSFEHYRGLAANGIAGSGATYPQGIPGHLSLVADPVTPSRTVMAATRNLGDQKTLGGYRSEVSTSKDPLGVERWYSAGFYLPENWAAHDSEVVLMQIANTHDASESAMRSPTLKISVQNDVISLINAYDYDKITKPSGLMSHAGTDYTRRTLASWGLKTGEWTYLDIHAMWAGDDSGTLEVWKNGVVVFNETDHINTFNDDQGVYFKAGMYAYPSPDWISLTSLFTGVRVGDGTETLQSMTMVPEPSRIALLAIGGVILLGAVRRKRT